MSNRNSQPVDASTPPLTSPEYAARAGLVCPYCRSSDIEGGNPSPDGPGAVGVDVCNNCHKTWKTSWKVAGYRPDGGDDPPVPADAAASAPPPPASPPARPSGAYLRYLGGLARSSGREARSTDLAGDDREAWIGGWDAVDAAISASVTKLREDWLKD